MFTYNNYIKLFFISLLSLVCMVGVAQIQITYPLSRMVFQRNNSNNASIAITGYYQQTIDRVEARAVAIQGGTTTAWQTIQTNPKGGFYSGSLAIAGGWYQLEVRGSLAGSVVASATLAKFGVGEVFVVSGQSNAAGYYNFGGPAASDDRVNTVDFYDSSGNTSYSQPSFIHLDANSPVAPHGQSAWCWGKLGDLIASRYNVPVMFYNTAFDGTLARNWAESADGGSTLSGYINAYYNPGQPFVFLKTTLNYYASMTGARAVLWHQGESDTQLSTTATAYKNALQTVINKSRQYYGNNIGWMVARVSYIRGFTSSAVISGQDQTIASTSNTFQGPNTDGIQIPRANMDIHFQGSGLTDLAAAWNSSLDQNFFNSCSPIMGSYPNISATCGTNSVSMSVSTSSINWSNGSSSTSLSLGAGSYNALAKDGSGNAYFIPSFTVQPCTAVAGCTNPSAPSISANPASINSGSNSTLTATNCTGTVTWSNGATGNSITVSPTQTTNYTATCTVTGPSSTTCTSGNSNTATVTIVIVAGCTNPSAPSISASPTSTTSGLNSTLTATNCSGTVTWSNGATGNSITVTPAQTTNYTATCTVTGPSSTTCTSGNSNTATVTITGCTPPATPTISISGSTQFCQGGQVTFTSSVVSGNTWSNGATSQSITVGSSGNYSVRVANASGCTATSNSVSVTVISPPGKPTISAQSSTNFCNGNSTTLVSSGANQYNWSNGQNGQSITVSNGGSFSLTVSNGNGCTSQASDPINVNVFPTPATPTITANKGLSICSSDNITLSSNQQQNYAWSNGQNGQSITVNQAGNYWVKAIDGNGCYSAQSSTILLNVNPLPNRPTISASGSTALCQGQQVSLSSNYNSNITWNTNQTSQQITTSNAGQFTVKYRDANGCESTSDVVNVVVNSLPAAPSISNLSPLTFCQNDNTTLSIPLSSNDYQYNWSTGQSSQQISVNTATNINATVTFRPTGCTSPTSSTVTTRINPLPAAPTITSNRNPVICAYENITFSSNPQLNYAWSSGQNGQNITVNQNGNYSVRAIDGNNCTSAPSNTIQLVVNQPPAKPIISPYGSTTICQGQRLGMEVNYGSGLTWSTTETTKQINVTNAGSYTVKYRDNNGCESTSDAVNVVVNSLPAPPAINNLLPTTFCQNDNTVLTIPLSSNDYQYNWNTGQNSQQITVNTATSINATVTFKPTGCTSPTSSTVTTFINPLPAAPVISSNRNPVICAYENIVFSSNPQLNYSWSSGQLSSSITVNQNGLYSVRAIDANKCVSPPSNVIQLVVNQPPTKPIISPYGSTTICQGQKLGMEVNYNSGLTWNTTENAKQIFVAVAGSYSVTYKDNNGCETISDAIVVKVNQLPEIPKIINERPIVFCQNDSTVLTLPPSSDQFYFGWSTGQKTQKISVKKPGSINATVTSIVTGCTSPTAETVNITVNPNPTQPTIATSGSTTFCADENVSLTANEPTAISYEWSSQSNSRSVTINKEGNYSVRVKNQFGCLSVFSNPTFIKVNPLPAIPSVVAENPLEFCDGDKAGLRVDSPNEVIWNTNDASKKITVSKSGTYKARVKDSNGCLSPFSTDVKVDVKPLPVTPVIEKTGIYTLEALGSDQNGIYTWNIDGKKYDDTRIEIKAKQAGKYQVQVAVKYSAVLTCYSKVSSFVEYVPEIDNNKLGVYPNPAKGSIIIETLDDLKDVNVNFYSSAGRIINTSVIPFINERKKLDISFLPPGTYILELISPSYRATKKLIVVP